MIRFFLVLVTIYFSGVAAFAAEEVLAGSQYDEAKEVEIAKIAKKREYPGGRDESDLKVQAQIVTPVRKLAPQAEVKNEEPAEE